MNAIANAESHIAEWCQLATLKVSYDSEITPIFVP